MHIRKAVGRAKLFDEQARIPAFGQAAGSLEGPHENESKRSLLLLL